jgi:hypothetical protein
MERRTKAPRASAASLLPQTAGTAWPTVPAAVAGLAASQLGPAETKDLRHGKAALSASPSSVVRVGGDMVGEVAIEPAVDAIGGDQNAVLRIVRITRPSIKSTKQRGRSNLDGTDRHAAACRATCS